MFITIQNRAILARLESRRRQVSS